MTYLVHDHYNYEENELLQHIQRPVQSKLSVKKILSVICLVRGHTTNLLFLCDRMQEPWVSVGLIKTSLRYGIEIIVDAML